MVVLDEYTLTLIAAWTRERTRLYPRCTNPHLLVSQRTATTTAPLSPYGLARLFDPLEIAPEQLRVDRLLDEAQHTRDPVQLMRILGLSKATAMKYVTTAHSELFTIDPTRP